MKRGAELLTTADYARVLRPHLPPEAFRAEPRHLARVALHLAVLLCGYGLVRMLPMWAVPMGILIIGHSLGCIAFLAHDATHHSILATRFGTHVLELLLWGLEAIPPTLWRRLHNENHHAETNTVFDPDRPFRESENCAANRIYMRAFFPNRKTPLRHPFVLFHFVTYVLRHAVTAFLPGDTKLPIVTFKPRYTVRQRLTILAEIVWIGGLQFGIWHLVGGTWIRYACAGPAALLVASSVVMAYVFTQHFLNPVCERTDPLIGSTSIIVPPWVDWLHDNISYHTEHHVFPGMNPRHFPAVSRLLAEHFPERYQRISFREAWRRLWAQDEFIRE